MKLLKYASVAGALLLVATSAQAGIKVSYPVVIAGDYFQGAIGTARNSADSNQYLLCQDHGSYANCKARNTSGTIKSCTTTNANHLNTIRGIGDSSAVRVYFNSSANCTKVVVYQGSYFEPKVK
jgi:hypothetical protein